MTSLTSTPDSADWLKRTFSLRPVALCLFVGLLLISELRFDWIEQIAGRFLVVTNPQRPEFGAIWEKGHSTEVALETLNQLVTDRQRVQREAREAQSFVEVARLLDRGLDVVVSAEHFQQLYGVLPTVLADELLSPFTLIRIQSQGQWDRAYFEPAGKGLTIYFLNRDNRVLHQVTVGSDLLARIERGESPRNESLDNLPQFAARIYPAERFFAVLEELPEDVRRNVIPWPENLIQSPGRIVRVGISDEILSGRIEIGLEFEEPPRTYVTLLPGRDWAVGRLRAVLEGERFESEIKF